MLVHCDKAASVKASGHLQYSGLTDVLLPTRFSLSFFRHCVFLSVWDDDSWTWKPRVWFLHVSVMSESFVHPEGKRRLY